jgi:alpha 1,3-glucosidase
MLPPLWALGYHQCRWNYMSQEALLTINNKMSEHNIPCDSLWLDIEYSDGKRYFLWDKEKFQNPAKMLKDIESHDRRLVTIIDPHLKQDDNYLIYKVAKEKGLLVKN